MKYTTYQGGWKENMSCPIPKATVVTILLKENGPVSANLVELQFGGVGGLKGGKEGRFVEKTQVPTSRRIAPSRLREKYIGSQTFCYDIDVRNGHSSA